MVKYQLSNDKLIVQDCVTYNMDTNWEALTAVATLLAVVVALVIPSIQKCLDRKEKRKQVLESLSLEISANVYALTNSHMSEVQMNISSYKLFCESADLFKISDNADLYTSLDLLYKNFSYWNWYWDKRGASSSLYEIRTRILFYYAHLHKRVDSSTMNKAISCLRELLEFLNNLDPRKDLYEDNTDYFLGDNDFKEKLVKHLISLDNQSEQDDKRKRLGEKYFGKEHYIEKARNIAIQLAKKKVQADFKIDTLGLEETQTLLNHFNLEYRLPFCGWFTSKLFTGKLFPLT